MFFLENGVSNDIAIIDEYGEKFTYKDLKLIINDFSKNIPNNSLVFNLVSNDLSSIVSYLSFLDNKVVSLLLSENIKESHLQKLINIYQPKLIFCEKRNINNYEKIKSFRNKHLLINNSYNNFDINKDLSLLLTTSGSTGSPKLVKISNKNLLSNSKSICSYLKLSKSDISITSLPLNYSYGLSIINSHFYIGGSTVLSKNSMIEKKFWGDVNDNNVTNISGVPYNYEIILKLGIDNLQIPSLKFMTQAGGKLSENKIDRIIRDLNKKNIKFYIMYGQTEATARIAYLPPSENLIKKNCIGRAIPNGEIYLVDENGNLIEKNREVGEMIYKGPNVSMGYAETKNDLSIGDVNRGILKTGDLAYFDENKYFYLQGKKSRYIKVFGNRISLDSIESIISKMEYLSAVTGDEDKIFIYIENNINFSKDKFLEKISEEITINMSSISLKILDELPRLETGKIDYKNLNNLSNSLI